MAQSNRALLDAISATRGYTREDTIKINEQYMRVSAYRKEQDDKELALKELAYHQPKENWSEDQIIEENLNYELYGKDSKLGERLQQLEWDVDNYHSLEETRPFTYAGRKVRLRHFKEDLANFEAQL